MNNLNKVISELVKLNNDSMLISDVKETYLLRCKHECRLPTLDYYTRHLNQITDFLESINVTATSHLNSKVFYEFVDYKRKQGCNNNTINKSVNTLRSALNYCVEKEFTLSNPLAKHKSLRKEDAQIKIINDSILKSIFTYLNVTEQTKEVLRTKVMIYLLIDIGVRKNELRNIKLSSPDLAHNEINLTFTKTHKNKTLYLSDDTVIVINKYLEYIKPTEYLLVSLHTGVQLSGKAMEDSIMKLKRKLNLPSNVSISFHKFRHTFATKYLMKDRNVDTVWELLGHSSIKATQLYLHQSNLDIKLNHK